MGRCSSCNGVVTKQDSLCYMCGARLPKRARVAVAGKPLSPLSNMLFVGSLGFTAYCWLAPHKLPLAVSIGISGIFLALSFLDRYRNKKSGQSKF